MNGNTGLSVGRITFGRNRRSSIRRAVEDIEHLLIWALTPSENESKNFTLPVSARRQPGISKTMATSSSGRCPARSFIPGC
jgi:hypothetical protein